MIGAHSKAPHVKGYLIEPSRRTDDATFQSFKVLSIALFRNTTVSLDYLDDLESFFYVLVWMCYTFDGEVGGKHYCIPAHQRARALTCWATHPTSRESILEKEAMLWGRGIMYLQSPVSRFEDCDYVEMRTTANEDYTAVIESIKWALYEWERRG